MVKLVQTFDNGTDGSNVGTASLSGDEFDFGVTSGSAVYDDDITIHDALTALVTAADGQSPYFVWNSSWDAVSSAAEVWVCYEGQFADSTPSINTQILQIRESNGTTVGCEVQLSTTGAFRLRAPTTLRYTSTTTLANGEPFRLEVHVLSHPSTGHIEARLYVGANINGATPDEVIGDFADNWDTGDGTVGGIAAGITASPGANGLVATLDRVVLSDEGWIGARIPPAPASVQYCGVRTLVGPPPPSASSILIPDTGAWWGGVVAAADASTSSTEAGLTLYNSMSGIRPLQIIGVYKTGNWNGTFSAGELAMLADAGGGDPAIPHVRWKPGTSGSPSNWATVAGGSVDSVLDTAFEEMATWPGKMFFTFHHEPEDDAGPTNYTDADWVAAWIRCHDRAALAGATNLIWVPNFMGFYGHISHVVAMMSGIEGYFDWIAQDPYAAETASRDTLGELLNWDPFNNWGALGPGYDGFYDWANTVYPGVPQMLAEFGVDGGSDSAHGVIDATDAITIINNWKSALASYPAVKAYQYWHADGIGDYQLTDRGGVGVSAFVSFTNDAYFAQDPTLAYD